LPRVLICQYSKSKNQKCKYIQLYIDNRDTLFEELSKEYKCTKDKIKNGFLRILNGAKSFLKMNDDAMPCLLENIKRRLHPFNNVYLKMNPNRKK
jgi:hypothetical protein